MDNGLDVIEKYIGMNIEKSRFLTEEERYLLGDIRAGLKRRYKLLAWALTGDMTVTAISDKYNEFVNRYEVFRRRFIYKKVERPLCITCEKTDERVPTMDLSNATPEKQETLIMDIISAESRKMYNPEEDAPLKLQIFITGKNRMVILMKVYQYIDFPMTPFDIRRHIFYNMKIDSNSNFYFNEELVEKANDNAVKKCVDFWGEKFTTEFSPVTVPFIGKDTEAEARYFTICKDISDDLFKKVSEYIERKNASIEGVFLKEFASFIGEYNDNKKLILGVRHKYTLMQIMPVFINLDEEIDSIYESIVGQQTDYFKYCDCYFTECMNRLNVSPDHYFRAILEFQNEDNESEELSKRIEAINGNTMGDFVPALVVKVIYSSGKISLQYTYDASLFADNTITMIHDSIIELLEGTISKSKKFDWRTYISEYKDQDEKIRKVYVAQKALFIKDSGLINTDDPEEMLKLAESGSIGNYIVEDTIVEGGRVAEHIGILVSGHIEERMMDHEGMIKTISVYKPGYIFAIESLLEAKKCQTTFVAADGVKVMWLKTDVLKEFISNHPDVYEVLLNKTLDEALRLKKLWILD